MNRVGNLQIVVESVCPVAVFCRTKRCKRMSVCDFGNLLDLLNVLEAGKGAARYDPREWPEPGTHACTKRIRSSFSSGAMVSSPVIWVERSYAHRPKFWRVASTADVCNGTQPPAKPQNDVRRVHQFALPCATHSGYADLSADKDDSFGQRQPGQLHRVFQLDCQHPGGRRSFLPRDFTAHERSGRRSAQAEGDPHLS